MNRRSFFKVCAVAAAGAAAPSVVIGAITKSRDPFAVIGGLQENVSYRLDYGCWQVHYLYRGKDGTELEWATLHKSYAAPTEKNLKLYREVARVAVERALRRRA